VAVAAIRIENDSIVVEISVNGHSIDAVLDTGDALGPTLTAADAKTCGVTPGAPIGVEGAGGASTAFSAVMNVGLGGDVYTSEPGAIDNDLEGMSLIGLPWFLDKCDTLVLALKAGELLLA
jgi:predicted aspartyl protease